MKQIDVRTMSRRGLAKAASWTCCGLLGGLVAAAVLDLPADRPGLAEAALAALDRSGVENPVTAVLMNYRAYDTFLEIAVLFVATLGVWSMAVEKPRPVGSTGLVLEFMDQLLVPFLLLFAAYLLWAGGTQPGGAFQAGAVLAAAGVLASLSRTPVPHAALVWQRVALALGLMAFGVACIGTMVAGGVLLEFPARLAKATILGIEAAATVSIGAMLLAIFRGGRPPVRGRS
jgi:multisubunit Na+/H+ antiporter MnhB subunit